MTEAVAKARERLLRCFPGSYINERDEFIADSKLNLYFILDNCETVESINAKVLEWLSRAAFKTEPYPQEWRNKRFHQAMLLSINSFLGTDFSEDDMEFIYTYLGNAIDHPMTMMFLFHEMNIEWLRKRFSANKW